jgi:hypothetical protein
MKNLKILGIIALAAIIGFSMVGCKKGGTLTIENKTNGAIYAIASSYDGKTVPKYSQKDYETVKKGASVDFTFDDDGEVYWYWVGGAGLDFKYKSGSLTIEGGAAETITAK